MLRAAECELFSAAWSQRILEEVVRNLIADGRATGEQANRMAAAMDAAFDSAAVPDPAIAQLEASMTNHLKDRHVLAAAVACDAHAIVTFDLSHFPASACDPHAIEAIHPDGFLVELHDRYPAELLGALERQAAALRHPPLAVDDILTRLSATVPRFAERFA
jgi:hypothetical protein